MWSTAVLPLAFTLMILDTVWGIPLMVAQQGEVLFLEDFTSPCAERNPSLNLIEPPTFAIGCLDGEFVLRSSPERSSRYNFRPRPFSDASVAVDAR
jgi:hypothetical protein